MSGYVEFEEMMPLVLQKLFNEGIDESTFNKNRALYAIRQAYIEFVKRSHAIRRTISLRGQHNVAEYALFKQDGYVVNKIYSVIINDNGICYSPGKFCTCNCCNNTYNYQDGFLTLCPAPECDGQDIDICVSMFPASDECKMEERIYEMYREYIANGAVDYLLSKAASAPFQLIFEAGIDLAANEAAKSWSRRAVRKQRNKWVRR